MKSSGVISPLVRKVEVCAIGAQVSRRASRVEWRRFIVVCCISGVGVVVRLRLCKVRTVFQYYKCQLIVCDDVFFGLGQELQD